MKSGTLHHLHLLLDGMKSNFSKKKLKVNRKYF